MLTISKNDHTVCPSAFMFNSLVHLGGPSCWMLCTTLRYIQQWYSLWLY